MEPVELAAQDGRANLEDYERAFASFDWKEVERDFDWHRTGRVNMAHEAIDRHCESGRGQNIALLYVDDDGAKRYTFDELKKQSNRFGNVLRGMGIARGDRVFIFMPRSPELYISLMGIIKIGAVVGPLFEAFMEGAVRDRLEDSGAVAVVTTRELRPRIPLKDLPALKHIIIVGDHEGLGDGEISYREEMARAPDELEIDWVGREAPLILHYTSGSTGKPKGIVHAHEAMIGHRQTAKWVLDLKETDIYWCTADPGWVTGTSYGIFGPWLNGVTSLIRGGRFDVEKWFSTIDDYGVTVWYSAPTAFRRMMYSGGDPKKNHDLSSLRHICSVGEPLNPVVVHWAMRVFGLPIHDTWWMTETGMQVIANYPSLPVRPGSMGKPFPGTRAAILDEAGGELPPGQIGLLAVHRGWPAMMTQVWNNEAKYRSYFRNSWFVSGDLAYRDEQGYYWFQGRDDDIIKTSGERVGPFEVESKLLEHPAVVEAGVIGKPDPMRGAIIKAFLHLREGYAPSEELKKEIIAFVRGGLAAHAAPREIEFRNALPKTRSGKIMRRVLKAEELGLPTGDLSTWDDSMDFAQQDGH